MVLTPRRHQRGSNPRAFAVATRGHSHRPYRPVDDTFVLGGPDGKPPSTRALGGPPACNRRPDSRTLVSRVGVAWRPADPPNMFVHCFLALDRCRGVRRGGKPPPPPLSGPDVTVSRH